VFKSKGSIGGSKQCIVLHGFHRWIAYGLTSFGEGCGKANKFGIYTKVSNYSDWIKKIMAAAETQSSHYY